MKLLLFFLSSHGCRDGRCRAGGCFDCATRPACFGAAFLSLHPTQYAKTLTARLQASGARAYLVNTGWNGAGERISLARTRSIISHILSGEIDDADQQILPIFGLSFPTNLGDMGKDILDPRTSHPSEADWQLQAKELAKLFITNFQKFTDNDAGKALVSVGPQLS